MTQLSLFDDFNKKPRKRIFDFVYLNKELLKEGKKKCTVCEKIKPIDENFYFSKTVNKYESKCNECMVEYRKILKPIKDETRIKEELHQKGFKKCPSCDIVKPYDQYHKSTKGYNGVAANCKLCKSIRDKQYRDDPKHKDKLLANKKLYHQKIKDTPKYKAYQKKRNEQRDYKEEYRRAYENPVRMFKTKIRNLILSHLKRRDITFIKETSTTIDLLGTDFWTAKDHISKQFLPGMTWDNHGEWHIDHIIPMDAAGTDPELIKILCNYQNLQPLWSKTNLTKYTNIPLICTLWANPFVPYKDIQKQNDSKFEPVYGSKVIVHPGDIHGNFTIIKEVEKRNKVRYVEAKCKCGSVKEYPLSAIRNRGTQSCGCGRKNMAIKAVWTNQEINILLKNRKDGKLINDITKLIPTKNKNQITHKLNLLSKEGLIEKKKVTEVSESILVDFINKHNITSRCSNSDKNSLKNKSAVLYEFARTNGLLDKYLPMFRPRLNKSK